MTALAQIAASASLAMDVRSDPRLPPKSALSAGQTSAQEADSQSADSQSNDSSFRSVLSDYVSSKTDSGRDSGKDAPSGSQKKSGDSGSRRDGNSDAVLASAQQILPPEAGVPVIVAISQDSAGTSDKGSTVDEGTSDGNQDASAPEQSDRTASVEGSSDPKLSGQALSGQTVSGTTSTGPAILSRSAATDSPKLTPSTTILPDKPLAANEPAIDSDSAPSSGPATSPEGLLATGVAAPVEPNASRIERGDDKSGPTAISVAEKTSVQTSIGPRQPQEKLPVNIAFWSKAPASSDDSSKRSAPSDSPFNAPASSMHVVNGAQQDAQTAVAPAVQDQIRDNSATTGREAAGRAEPTATTSGAVPKRFFTTPEAPLRAATSVTQFTRSSREVESGTVNTTVNTASTPVAPAVPEMNLAAPANQNTGQNPNQGSSQNSTQGPIRGADPGTNQVSAAKLQGNWSDGSASLMPQTASSIPDSIPAASPGPVAFAARLSETEAAPTKTSDESTATPDASLTSRSQVPVHTTAMKIPAPAQSPWSDTESSGQKSGKDALVERFAKIEIPALQTAATERPAAAPVKAETASSQAPQTSSARLNEIIETNEPAAMVPSNSGRDITVRLPDATERGTDVRFVERGGEVHVSVRTGDAEMAQTLRGGLSDLVDRLGRGGIQAEVWRPASDFHSSQNDSSHANQDHKGSGGGGNPQGSHSGKRDQHEQNKPRWVEELETSIGRPSSTEAK